MIRAAAVFVCVMALAVLAVGCKDKAEDKDAAATEQRCPVINGHWYCNDLHWAIRQKGCTINGTLVTSGFNHTLWGKWNPKSTLFNVSVRRTDRGSGCTTIMYVLLKIKSGNTMTSRVYGSDGRCDLSPGFTEYLVYHKN